MRRIPINDPPNINPRTGDLDVPYPIPQQIDPRISQWNQEREIKMGTSYVIKAEAHEPKVKVENETFPAEWDTWNCTNCKQAEPEHPAWKLKSPESYKIKCKHLGMYSTGPRWNDIGCPWFDQKIKRPRHGYNHLETGPYDPMDRR